MLFRSATSFWKASRDWPRRWPSPRSPRPSTPVSRAYSSPPTCSPLIALLRRPQLTYDDLRDFDAGCRAFPPALAESVEIAVKFEGYIRRQMAEVAEFARLEHRAIPEDIDYAKIDGLRLEAREKLAAIRPQNLGQAGRISGVSPADVAALMLYITSKTRD